MPLTKDLPPEYHKAHPICVAKKVRELGWTGDPRQAPRDLRMRAAQLCIQEGKLHGIYKIFHGGV